MTRRPAPILLASAFLAASLSGCGSDPAGDPAASPAPSRATAPAAEPDGTGEAIQSGERRAPPGEGVQSSERRTTSGNWVTVVDEPSGARFALPGRVDRRDDAATIDDGSEVPLRNYAAVADGGTVEVGFNVIDAPGELYDFAAGVAGVEKSLDGSVVKASDTEVDGHRAVDVELTYGDGMLVLFQLIRTDEHIMQPLASGRESERGSVEATFEKLNTSVEVN